MGLRIGDIGKLNRPSHLQTQFWQRYTHFQCVALILDDGKSVITGPVIALRYGMSRLDFEYEL